MRRLLLGLIVGLALAGSLTSWAQQQPALSQTTASEQGGVWDDLVAPAGAINPLGASGQATVVNDEATYIGCLEFDAVNETAVVQWQLSHMTLDNTDIKPHIHWLVSGADVTGSATFEAQFKHCPVPGTCSAWSGYSDGTVDLEPADVEGGTGLTSWTLADSTYNFGVSDVILMVVRLKATTVTDAIVCSADIHYRKGPHGTTDERTR